MISRGFLFFFKDVLGPLEGGRLLKFHAQVAHDES